MPGDSTAVPREGRPLEWGGPQVQHANLNSGSPSRCRSVSPLGKVHRRRPGWGKDVAALLASSNTGSWELWGIILAPRQAVNAAPRHCAPSDTPDSCLALPPLCPGSPLATGVSKSSHKVAKAPQVSYSVMSVLGPVTHFWWPRTLSLRGGDAQDHQQP